MPFIIRYAIEENLSIVFRLPPIVRESFLHASIGMSGLLSHGRINERRKTFFYSENNFHRDLWSVSRLFIFS